MTERSVKSLVNRIPKPLIESEPLVFLQSVTLLVVVWYAIAHSLGLAQTISSPEFVAVELYNLLLSGEYIQHLIPTLRRIFLAFVVATVVGTTLGIAMGMSDFWEEYFRDYVIIALGIPSLFAAVFAGMGFGLSDLTPIVAGTIIAFPFLTQNVMEGVKDMDKGLIDMSKSFNVSKTRLIRRVVVGAVLPYWFSGLRYTFAIVWKLTVLAEVVASTEGMGFVIQQMMRDFSLSGLFSYVILFTAVIVVVEYGVFRQVENKVFDWREETSIGLTP